MSIFGNRRKKADSVEHIQAVLGREKESQEPEHILRHRRNRQLFLACQRGDLQKVKELLEKGASVHARWGETNDPPLIYAADPGHIELVEFLLDIN